MDKETRKAKIQKLKQLKQKTEFTPDWLRTHGKLAMITDDDMANKIIGQLKKLAEIIVMLMRRKGDI